MVSGRQNGPGFVTLYAQGAKCRPGRTYFTPKILRSSPRRHLGDRTTTMPIKTPPLCQNVLQYMAAGAEG